MAFSTAAVVLCDDTMCAACLLVLQDDAIPAHSNTTTTIERI